MDVDVVGRAVGARETVVVVAAVDRGGRVPDVVVTVVVADEGGGGVLVVLVVLPPEVEVGAAEPDTVGIADCLVAAVFVEEVQADSGTAVTAAATTIRRRAWRGVGIGSPGKGRCAPGGRRRGRTGTRSRRRWIGHADVLIGAVRATISISGDSSAGQQPQPGQGDDHDGRRDRHEQ